MTSAKINAEVATCELKKSCGRLIIYAFMYKCAHAFLPSFLDARWQKS